MVVVGVLSYLAVFLQPPFLPFFLKGIRKKGQMHSMGYMRFVCIVMCKVSTSKWLMKLLIFVSASHQTGLDTKSNDQKVGL